MKGRRPGRAAAAGLAALFALHHDFWLWNDSRLVLGLPVGLLYHLIYCVAASVLMALVVAFAWPSNLEVGEERGLPR